MNNVFKVFLSAAVLLLILMGNGCSTMTAGENSECSRHSGHSTADPHSHNQTRERLGLPPSKWATKAIAEEDAAYKRCIESEMR